jgi:ABC-type sugar transport system ATPase subunit
MSSAAQSLPIDVSSLCKAYGSVKALDNVSLNIAAGEFLTLAIGLRQNDAPDGARWICAT